MLQKIAVSMPALTGSSPASATSIQAVSSPELAASRAKLMFGCYRKGDANDPDTYTAAVAAVLGLYPGEVVARVTDPRTGLPGRSNVLPTVAEVRAACEELVRRETRVHERAAREQAQLAQRRALDAFYRAQPKAELQGRVGAANGRARKTE